MDTDSQKIDLWHREALPAQTKKALGSLFQAKWLEKSGWYLAGGTALALQVGHRQSVDLDFFTQKDAFLPVSVIRNFKSQKNWRSNIIEEGTVYGELFGAKISFIAYPFFVPNLTFKKYGRIKVLQPIDIAVMKIIAISQRGRKRDFFDLYWCAKNLEPMEDIIRKLKIQYSSVAHDYHHILKSLVYFTDAESDPDPKIFFPVKWKEVKKFFEQEIPQITKKLIGLK